MHIFSRKFVFAAVNVRFVATKRLQPQLANCSSNRQDLFIAKTVPYAWGVDKKKSLTLTRRVLHRQDWALHAVTGKSKTFFADVCW